MSYIPAELYFVFKKQFKDFFCTFEHLKLNSLQRDRWTVTTSKLSLTRPLYPGDNRFNLATKRTARFPVFSNPFEKSIFRHGSNQIHFSIKGNTINFTGKQQ